MTEFKLYIGREISFLKKEKPLLQPFEAQEGRVHDVRIVQGYYEDSELFHVFLVRKNKDIIDFTLCEFFDNEESIKEFFYADEYLEISLSKSFKEDILQKYQLPLIIKEYDELYSNYYQEEEINFCHSLVLFARESSCFSEYLEKVKKLSKMELISAQQKA